MSQLDNTPDGNLSSDKLEMLSAFDDLKHNSILLSIPGLFIGVLIMGAVASSTQDYTWALGVAIGLFFLIPLSWAASQRSFLIAALLVIFGLLGSILATVMWGHIYPALFLLVLPVGYICLTLDSTIGIFSAVAFTLLVLVAPGTLKNISNDLRMVTILGIWGIMGLSWLTLRPLLTAVDWSWKAVRRSNELLAKSQDFQVQLQQAIVDLSNANTQLNRLNKLANNLRQEAEDERRIKQQFVANVSHELRTPLNMIIGFSEMILKTPDTYGRRIPAALLADLEVVLRNSQNLSSLVDDVLDLSQIEAGQMALVREWVQVPEVVASAALSVRPLFESKHLNLEITIDRDLPQVYCDRTRIREVLLNLLSNAGRFTDEGGVEVQVWHEGSGVSFSVKDTGPGISDEDKNRLFQPFQQLDATTHRLHGGTGLGLNISRSFVEMHDGKMWVESKPGQGTTFSFHLPVEPAAFSLAAFGRWVNPYTVIEKPSQRISSQPLVDSRPRFLVVEDGTVLQRLLRRYLSNVEISAIADPGGVLAALEQTPAQVVLLNTGAFNDTASILREVNLPHNIPAILCSLVDPLQYIPNEDIPKALVKPVSRERLLQALADLQRPIKIILVVDDELDAQKLFTRMLTSARRGYRVLRAGNGLEALSLMRAQAVDVVLLDLFMPEMDGFQFLKAKAQDAQISTVSVVLISAQDLHATPVVSNYLAVARSGGLSVRQVLEFVQAFIAIMTPDGVLTPVPTSGAARSAILHD